MSCGKSSGKGSEISMDEGQKWVGRIDGERYDLACMNWGHVGGEL